MWRFRPTCSTESGESSHDNLFLGAGCRRQNDRILIRFARYGCETAKSTQGTHSTPCASLEGAPEAVPSPFGGSGSFCCFERSDRIFDGGPALTVMVVVRVSPQRQRLTSVMWSISRHRLKLACDLAEPCGWSGRPGED